MENKKSKKHVNCGSKAFIAGIAISLIIGILSGLMTMPKLVTQIVSVLLIIIGVIVGVMNISRKESAPFLVSSIALALLTMPFIQSLVFNLGLNNITKLMIALTTIYTSFVLVLVPAAIIVAFKIVFASAKDDTEG